MKSGFRAGTGVTRDILLKASLLIVVIAVIGTVLISTVVLRVRRLPGQVLEIVFVPLSDDTAQSQAEYLNAW